MPRDRETPKRQYKEDLFKSKTYEKFKNSTAAPIADAVQNSSNGTEENSPDALCIGDDSEACVPFKPCNQVETGIPLEQERDQAPKIPSSLPEQFDGNSSAINEKKDTALNSIEEPKAAIVQGKDGLTTAEEKNTVSTQLSIDNNRKESPGKGCVDIKSLIRNTIIKIKAPVPFSRHASLKFKIPRSHSRRSRRPVDRKVYSCAPNQDSNKALGKCENSRGIDSQENTIQIGDASFRMGDTDQTDLGQRDGAHHRDISRGIIFDDGADQFSENSEFVEFMNPDGFDSIDISDFCGSTDTIVLSEPPTIAHAGLASSHDVFQNGGSACISNDEHLQSNTAVLNSAAGNSPHEVLGERNDALENRVASEQDGANAPENPIGELAGVSGGLAREDKSSILQVGSPSNDVGGTGNRLVSDGCDRSVDSTDESLILDKSIDTEASRLLINGVSGSDKSSAMAEEVNAPIDTSALKQSCLDASSTADVIKEIDKVMATDQECNSYLEDSSTIDDPSLVFGECSLAFGSEDEASGGTSASPPQSESLASTSHHDTSSVSESDLVYSHKTLEFPDDEGWHSNDFLMEIDWKSVKPILDYVQSLESASASPLAEINEGDRPIHLDPDALAKTISIEEEIVKKDEIIYKTEEATKKESLKGRKEAENSAPTDLRYLYFLKKVCNLTKKDAQIYCKDQNKLLADRGAKNKAKFLPKKKYFSEVDQDNATIYALADNRTAGSRARATQGDKAGSIQSITDAKTDRRALESSVVLKRAPKIKDIQIPLYNKDEFGYLVYKYRDGLVSIASEMRMDLKDVILVYYLDYNNRHLEITGSLLEKYVEEEWTITDRILFEENFMKYSTKFNKFMINKSDAELRIYYRYYLKNYIPVNWTEQERSSFSLLFNVYKKDWNLMQANFPNKTSNELKVFYSSYFKKLDEEERAREAQLVGVEEAQVKTKKRGRKPNSVKLLEQKGEEE